MKKEKSNTSSGIGFTGMLTILFIGLKLCGKIDWSWWWVLSPSLISLAFVAIVAVISIIRILLK